jgi:hypothetical protein
MMERVSAMVVFDARSDGIKMAAVELFAIDPAA